jgi:hypothetical protein
MFTDVPKTHWARADIEAAAALGILLGYPDGTFRPARPVTRGEAAATFFRAMHLP